MRRKFPELILIFNYFYRFQCRAMNSVKFAVTIIPGDPEPKPCWYSNQLILKCKRLAFTLLFTLYKCNDLFALLKTTPVAAPPLSQPPSTGIPRHDHHRLHRADVPCSNEDADRQGLRRQFDLASLAHSDRFRCDVHAARRLDLPDNLHDDVGSDAFAQ